MLTVKCRYSMKIVQFLLDYIDSSPAKKRDEQAKQYIIGIIQMERCLLSINPMLKRIKTSMYFL
jgi:hypothetical protein